MVKLDALAVKKYIEQFEESEFRQWMIDGQRYYDGNNTAIMERKKQCYVGGGLVDDPFKANHQLGSLYNRILVKQLTNYLLGNGITYQTDMDLDDLIDTVTNRFDKLVKGLADEAGAKGVAWLHPYIDNGTLKFKRFPAEQIIWIPNADDNEELDAVIRYYTVEVMVGNTPKKFRKVEYWDKDTVTYYIETAPDSCKYRLCNELEEPYNPMPHLQTAQSVNGNVLKVTGQGWGKVPFIPMWWNEQHYNQLRTVKRWIDIWDITASDFANNIDDFQDVYWILKNYNGQNVNEFLTDLKQFRALKVGEGGDAKAETLQIPVEAREKFLQLANDAIYKFGMGVDTAAVGDGNITNVVIKNRYTALDLKASEFQGMIEVWFDDLMYFVNEWHKRTGKTVYNDIIPVFDRSIIINKIEIMESIIKQKGIISDMTLLENHPLVTDVDTEVERLKEQADDNPVSIPDMTPTPQDETEENEDGTERN